MDKDEWIKNMWYIYTYIYIYIYIHTYTHTYTYINNGILLSHKKEWNNAICSNMDGPRDYHTKWSKPDQDKYHMISLIHGI